MPEEKKESFTFSDKIKNSKPAGSKSFAKSSSKIGRDGKPRQTLFERTRRDAPFFIAALVALLLLPFLYKYSGQSSEDTTLVTPGSEETMFDPERYGFDSSTLMEDPDGQIAQLSGRSSLDLIKGWGSSEEDYADRDDMDFDSSAESSAEASATGEYEAEGRYDAEHRARTDIDEEENITNIYKRRARKATRAAFRRTQIGKLDPTSMRRGGGSRLGINPWGGSLKNAAKKVGDEGPRKPTKPVSLQPLRAAGPARSSFGQGAAAAARKGLDNMGKADAKEALRDSYVKPVGPTRTGGIDLFADGRTGGSGKLDHNINIGKGQTPWWWDMMKTRMQKEWEARFNRKWDWIKWADGLAQNILKGLIYCLATGDSGGDPDNFLGKSATGGGGKKECCGWNEKKWKNNVELQSVPFDEDHCKSNMSIVAKAKGIEVKDCAPWKDTTSAGAGVGFFGQRLCCLGLCGGAYVSGELGLHAGGDKLDCEEMPYHYTVVPTGQARKWNIYTYVVARNYFPNSLKAKFPELPTTGKNLLCASMDKKHGGTGLAHYQASAGVGHVTTAEGGEYKDKARGTIIKQIRSTNNVSSRQQEIRENILEVDQESLADACVLVVARGNTISYEGIKNQIIDLFMALGKDKNVTNKEAEEAFYQLDLMLVSSFAVKDKLSFDYILGNAHKLKGMLPMPYWEFENAYINHKGVTNKQGQYTAHTVYDKKWRVEGTDLERGPICYFEDMKFECGPEDAATAKLVINSTSFRGGQWVNDPQKQTPDGIEVSAKFSYLAGDKHPVTQPMIAPKKSADGYSYTYTMDRIYDDTSVQRTKAAIDLYDEKEGGLIGNIRWTAKRGKHEIVRDCPLNLSGDGSTVIVESKPCPNGIQSNQECCEEQNANDRENTYVWVNGKCEVTPKCPQGRDTNKECCEKDSNFKWDEETRKCVREVTPTPIIVTTNQYTIFAPGIRCVPHGVTDRKARPEEDMTQEQMCTLFGNPLVRTYNQPDGQSCVELWGFKMDSAKATAFVNRVKEAYNNAHPELPIRFDKQYPQDSEFIDALNIAPTVGINDVPAAAVCELGRDFVRMSKDKHAGDREIREGATGTKGEPLIFRNELGAFLAYVHDTSILYPDAFVRYQGQSSCDWRFQPYNMEDGGCGKQLGPKMGKGYAHNNYNSGGATNKYDVFMKSLTSVMKEAPLAALVRGKQDLFHNCGECKKPSNNTVKTYNSYRGFAGLLHEESASINGQGVACEAFLAGNKDATMSVADALKYIKGVCEAGLDYKPHGIGDPNYQQGQKPTRTAGSSSGSQIVGRQINQQ